MDSQWLKEQFRQNPGHSKAELAKALGLEPPAVSKILNATRQIKAQEYLVMRAFFNLPVDDDVGRRDLSYTLKPLDENRNGVSENPANTTENWVIPASVVSKRTQASPEQVRIFHVRESVMEPDFRQGEHVLVDLSDTRPSPPGPFIVSDGFGFMLRDCAYVPKTNPPRIKIAARSSDFHMQTLDVGDFLIIGRVIAKLQMV